MSDIVQPGIHPDADQLSAFVEHVLPAHEQQRLLAHLAICSECRTIVALSLPPIEEAPGLQPMQEGTPSHRRPHFASWKLAWPAVAALAALVLLIVHFSNSVPIQDRTFAPAQVAEARPPAPPAPLSVSPIPQREQKAPLSAKPRLTIRHHSSSEFALSSAPSAGSLRQAQPIQSLPLQNRYAFRQGSAIGAIGGMLTAPTAGVAAGSAARENPLAASADALQPSIVNGQPVDTASSATPTLNVSSMSRSLALDQAHNIFAQAPLPSQRPVLSMATNGRQRLAIDTQNALFFSEDEGKHWKGVPSPWHGRAVHVALASSSLSYPQGGPTINGRVVSPALAVSSLTGAIVDPSGAVIAGATVVATDIHTALIHTVTTNGAGQYRIEQLTSGSYQIAAHAPGFSEQSFSADIRPTQKTIVNFTLPVGSAAQTVDVQAAPEPFDTSPIDAKKAVGPSPATPPIFAVTTDTGERWTSSDGQRWRRQ